MAKSIAVIPKKRGRPATGRDPVTAVRLPSALKSKVGAWANNQNDKPSLSEAIRRLVEQALAAKRHSRREAARKLAASAIERLADKSLPKAEQEERKRRLIRGPKEFRDIRAAHRKIRG